MNLSVCDPSSCTPRPSGLTPDGSTEDSATHVRMAHGSHNPNPKTPLSLLSPPAFQEKPAVDSWAGVGCAGSCVRGRRRRSVQKAPLMAATLSQDTGKGWGNLWRSQKCDDISLNASLICTWAREDQRSIAWITSSSFTGCRHFKKSIHGIKKMATSSFGSLRIFHLQGRRHERLRYQYVHRSASCERSSAPRNVSSCLRTTTNGREMAVVTIACTTNYSFCSVVLSQSQIVGCKKGLQFVFKQIHSHSTNTKLRLLVSFRVFKSDNAILTC